MNDDIRVTIRDVRKAGLCVRGARRWCESYGIDFKALLEEGVLASQVEATKDPLGMRAVRAARERKV